MLNLAPAVKTVEAISDNYFDMATEFISHFLYNVQEGNYEEWLEDVEYFSNAHNPKYKADKSQAVRICRMLPVVAVSEDRPYAIKLMRMASLAVRTARRNDVNNIMKADGFVSDYFTHCERCGDFVDEMDVAGYSSNDRPLCIECYYKY